MLARLERAFDAQRLFVANASHELRGPLTVIRTAADLAAVTRTLLEDRSTPGPTVHAALHPALTHGDLVLVERLVRNLLDNALRYTPADGWVRIHTGRVGTDGQDEQAAELEIENTGHVITAEQAWQFLQPFHRGERIRPAEGEGFGLGLAIAEAIIDAHAGHLRIAPRAGGGLCVTVTLPHRQQRPASSPEGDHTTPVVPGPSHTSACRSGSAHARPRRDSASDTPVAGPSGRQRPDGPARP
jgi:signal transduction histidine kinase